MNWAQLERRQRVVTTNSEGEFELHNLPRDPDVVGSVLWVTCAGFNAKAVLLDFPSTAMTIPPVIELDASGRLSARVVDSTGHSVAGAAIVQMVYLGRDNPELGSGKELESKYLLRRMSRSDDKGSVLLSSFPVLNWVYAESDGVLSKAWAGIPPAEVLLELRQTFTVSGQVFLEPGVAMDPRTSVRVSLRNGDEFRSLDRFRVRPDASWGPEHIPVEPCEEMVFVLEGGSLTQERVSVALPRPGDVVTVDFHPHAGIGLTLLVLDADGKAIPNALTHVQWMDNDHWNDVQRYTDAKGLAALEGCSPGMLYPGVTCPGYVPKLVDPIQLSSNQIDPIKVNLDRAALVHGSCTHAGKPVNEFIVQWWHKSVEDGSLVRVRNSADGGFTISEAPQGDVFLFATSKDYPQSEVQHVVATLDHPTEVSLELPDPFEGHGKIVDAITGEPIKGASVQLYTHYLGGQVDKYNAPATTDLQGMFNILGLTVGSNPIEVSASGYSKRTVRVTGVSAQSVDCGLIPLFRKQAIECRLESDEVISYAGIQAQLEGAAWIPRRPFSADGVLRYEALDPGLYSLRLYPSDNLSYQVFSIVLSPGKDAIHRIQLSTHKMFVDVIPEPGETVPEHLDLGVFFQSKGGEQLSQYYGVNSHGHVEIMRVEGDIVLTLFVGQDVLAAEHFSVGPETPGKIDLHFKAIPHVFRIVDPKGSPLSGVLMSISIPTTKTEWMAQARTDVAGLARFQGLMFDDVLFSLARLPEGTQGGRPMHLGPSSETPVDIVFDPQAALEVLTLERSAPMSGVELWASDALTICMIGSASSNEQAVASWGSVSEGKFRVRVAHPGYWPTEQIVEAGAPGHPAVLQVRRLGNIELLVRNAYDSPAPGIPIDMYSEEMRHWVSAWIESGDVIAPAGGMLTSSEGRLLVNGLPNGTFTWRATTTTGNSVEGSLIVPPSGTGYVAITVPE